MEKTSKFVKENSKVLIISIAIIVAAIILSLSGAFRSSQDHCYYKLYKHYMSKGADEEQAAKFAKQDCR